MKHRSRDCFGFSLIELVIALGIATFAIIAVIGVLPVGLSTLHSAMDQFIEARIIHKISADLKMTAFENIADGAALFDQEGYEILSEKEARYRAIFGVRHHGTAIFPGASDSISQNLAIVKVDIFRIVSEQKDILTASFPLAMARGE